MIESKCSEKGETCLFFFFFFLINDVKTFLLVGRQPPGPAVTSRVHTLPPFKDQWFTLYYISGRSMRLESK